MLGIEGFGPVEADRSSQPAVRGAVGCANSLPAASLDSAQVAGSRDRFRPRWPSNAGTLRGGRRHRPQLARTPALASCRLTTFNARRLLDACNIVGRCGCGNGNVGARRLLSNHSGLLQTCRRRVVCCTHVRRPAGCWCRGGRVGVPPRCRAGTFRT
jgi:hypothetical protein